MCTCWFHYYWMYNKTHNYMQHYKIHTPHKISESTNFTKICHTNILQYASIKQEIKWYQVLVAVFCDVTPCSLVWTYKCFGWWNLLSPSAGYKKEAAASFKALPLKWEWLAPLYQNTQPYFPEDINLKRVGNINQQKNRPASCSLAELFGSRLARIGLL